MNCLELKQDIENLRAAQEELQAQINRANETSHGKDGLLASSQSTSAATNKVLSRYLQDFADQNPEFFGWTFGTSFDKNINIPSAEDNFSIVRGITVTPDDYIIVHGDGFVSKYTEKAGRLEYESEITENPKIKFDTNSIGTFSNGNLVIGGSYSLWGLQKDDQGHYTEKAFDAPPDFHGAKSVVVMSDNTFLLVGTAGKTYKYRNSNGEWHFSESELNSYLQENQYETVQAKKLSSGQVLIIIAGKLLLYDIDRAGKEKIEELKFDNSLITSSDSIMTIAELPSGNIMLGTSNGGLIQGEGNHVHGWDFTLIQESTIENIVANIYGGDDVEHHSIGNIVALSENSVLVSDGSNNLEYQQVDGKWEASSEIGGFTGKDGEKASAFASAILPSGKILIGGSNAALHEIQATAMEPTFNNLKQALPFIAAKAPATVAV